MKKLIEEIIAPYKDKAKIGIEVFSLTRNQDLFSYNENEFFIPASCTKLFTVVAAYELLGSDFFFSTTFFSDAKPSSLLNGNLYVKGSGDPTFTKNDLEKMVGELIDLGIRKIAGNVILDTTAFDHVYKAPGVICHEDDEEALWGAKVSGLNLNFNCERVWVHPTEIGMPPRILPETIPLSYFSNFASTNHHAGEVKIFKKDRYEITGGIGALQEPIECFLPVESPLDFFGKAFTRLLKEKGIMFEGKVLHELVNEKAHILASHRSKKLSELFYPILKDSDNLYADALFKTMGARKEKLGSWESGRRAVWEFFDKKMGMDKFDVYDGSGLSHHNQVSPRWMNRLLKEIYYDKKKQEEIFSALPVAGEDGTLKDRMKEAPKKTIFAKTGSLKEISSLCGFITTKNREAIAFSIFANQITCSIGEYKNEVENRVCLLLSHL